MPAVRPEATSSPFVKRAAIALLAVFIAVLPSVAQRQTLPIHVPVAALSRPVGKLPQAQKVDLTIALPLQNRHALTNLIAEVHDPASPLYGRYLSPEEFARQFGPSESDYQNLIAFAKANGLAVTRVHPNRTLLEVGGSVADIEKLFHTSLRVYQHPTESRTFYAPDAELALDAPVRILSVSGLDNFAVPRRMNPLAAFKKARDAVPYALGFGPGGDFLGRDFRNAYAPGTALDGAGQSVGLFEFDGYFLADVRAYENLAGLPDVPITNVLVGTATGASGADNFEVALDIEMVISMAPGVSNVMVYEGRFNASPVAVLNRMATDNLAKQLSCSWGFGPQIDPAREQVFLQFAAQGQTFFQASGDIGAWSGPILPPSGDPWVTVVGGTSLTTSNAGGAWASEVAWSGSGGGFDTNYSMPSWQQGTISTTNQGSTAFRNIPDVACLADQDIFAVVNNGQQGTISGTSAAAPLWAGFAALANQQAAAVGKPPLGFLNPALYAVGKGPVYEKAFHDITSGNNTNASNPNRFFAVPGYDLCTGWGTPNGTNLINALLDPPDALKITPVAPLIISGPAGGPFSPASQSFSLTNIGKSPIGWALVTTSSWVNASPSSGTLVPGGGATNVTFTLKPAASNFMAGTYTDSILFNNLNNDSVQQRQVTLAVVTRPVIAAQPSNQAVFEGMSAAFSVSAATNALLAYQWQYDNGMSVTKLIDGPGITGATASTLLISNAFASNVGAYSVIVSNAAGSVLSSNAFLTLVPSRPVIAGQSPDQTAFPEQTVGFSVTAAGSQPLSYHWRQNGTNLSDSSDISGSTSSTLVLKNLSANSAGTYSVVVTNSFGAVTNTGAVLTILPLAAPGIALATMYSFDGGINGANPRGLTQGSNGLLYGITENGGTGGGGTAFQLATNGVLSPLVSFSGVNNGARPLAPLLRAMDGNFYGTTYHGGASDYGLLFRLTPGGAFSVLHSLTPAEGVLPYASLIQGMDGNFYGTCIEGGSSSYGTVFKVSPNGTLSPLCFFSDGADGGLPYGGVAQGPDGGLYGTTYQAGASGAGTFFKVTTNGLFTTLFSFSVTNGAFPAAAVVLGGDGNFLGTTSGGGATGNGTIFRISPNGSHTNLYSFTGGMDGSSPAAALFQANDGNYYGTTAYGGAYGFGTLFRLAPNGSFATLAQFAAVNGANPLTALMQAADGSIYGTTQNGGPNGRGAIFRLSVVGTAPQITTQPSSQSVFAGSNVMLSAAIFGSQPLFFQWRENGTNLADAGNLSGANARVLTLANVSAADAGAYSLFVSNAFGSVTSSVALLQVTSSPPIIVQQPTNQTVAPGSTVVLAASATGNQPLLYQWQKNGTNVVNAGNVSGANQSTLVITSALETNSGMYSLLVSNTFGSATSSVAVLKVVPVSIPGTRLTTVYAFNSGNDGDTPNGLTRGTNGYLYGTTRFGGSNHLGTLFALPTNGPLTYLAAFAGTNGSNPYARLVQAADGNFYGTAKNGGDDGDGTVFKLTSDGVLASVHSFSGDYDGGNPVAALIEGNDRGLYGVSSGGTNGGYGLIFRVLTSGIYSTVYVFTNGADGSFPDSALVQAADGNFYGLTEGGTSGFGNVFRMTSTGIVTNLYTFRNGTDGSAPQGPLIQASDGSLYGATMHNTIQGYPFYGTIFKITTNGVFSTLYALNLGEGVSPHSGLLEASDGNFYGTTSQGGASDNGTVFRITPNGSFTSLLSFDGFDTGGGSEAPLVEGPDGSLYGVTTTGGPGGHGTIFRLSMTQAPQILTQPASQAVLAGGQATLRVTVFGAPPLTYHWQRSGTNLIENANVSGVTGRILSFNNLSLADAGSYSVVVSNSFGSISSSNAVITIVSPPAFQSIARTNGNIRLTWNGTPGQKYQLQFKSTLLATNWANLGSSITATSATVTASDPLGPNAQRFYRVILLP